MAAARNTAVMIELDRAYVLDVDSDGNWTVRAGVLAREEALESRDTISPDEMLEHASKSPDPSGVVPFGGDLGVALRHNGERVGLPRLS